MRHMQYFRSLNSNPDQNFAIMSGLGLNLKTLKTLEYPSQCDRPSVCCNAYDENNILLYYCTLLISWN